MIKKIKWDIKLLEDSVRRIHGNSYAEKIHDPLQSFAWKINIADFHAFESERVIREAIISNNGIRNEDYDSFTVAKAILLAASPGKKGKHILDAQFKAEAHIIASAQALHSLCDILSVVIYWSLQLDAVPESPPIRKINLHSINRIISEIPRYSNISNLINAIIKSSEFKYLAAYVNTTKHKSLVSSALSASFEADNKNGMRIQGFSYEDLEGEIINYNRKWSHDFLFLDNHALKFKLVEIGKSLNDNF